MSLSNNFPTIDPSLMLDFANTQSLDPRITFTRTTTATYYNGVTTAKAEENLLLYSQALATIWLADGVTATNNNAAAPDGTTTATSVLQVAGRTVYGSVRQSTNFVTGLSYVYSVFAKPNGKNFVVLRERSAGTNRETFFDVQNGTVGTTNGSHTATITASTNGFYRCSIVFTATTTASQLFYFLPADTDGSSTTVDDGNGLYLWGAQLEQRSAITAYTPTTTQPITNYIPVLLTAPAGVARFDHNPTTGESLGLLVEEQRTNLCLRSEDFSTTWTITRSSVTANTIVAPDGTLTGDKLVEDTTASNTHFARQTISGTTNTNPLTYSVYVKAGERTYVGLAIQEGTTFTRQSNVIFNLTAGTAGAVSNIGGAGSSSATITPVGNGWYRCTLTTTLGGSDTNVFCWNYISLNTGLTYTGDGYSGIYLWGAQLEAASFSTSYIKTEGSTVTRNADVATMTGTNFSSWYRQDEGTMYAEISPNQFTSSSAFPGFFSIDVDGLSANRFLGFYNSSSGAIGFVNRLNSTATQLLTSGTATSTTSFKFASATKVNDIAATANGASVVTSTPNIPLSLNRIRLGFGDNPLNGTIKKLAYYPSRLSNAQLQALTS